MIASRFRPRVLEVAFYKRLKKAKPNASPRAWLEGRGEGIFCFNGGRGVKERWRA